MASRSPLRRSPSPQLLDERSVKKEAPDDEIKEFAETAMNELLGWYGYDARSGRGGKAGRATPSPHTSQRPPGTPPLGDNDDCAWCNTRITAESHSLNAVGDKFCSELCFSQSRRANFKRAKTCDWCRHVRHTVSYVDFQDGATQLQFCSDKCLNQYKMHIFCRETQAHLDLNPHLIGATSSNTNLITPDLWMKNCKSRSNSSSSERSVSPTAENIAPIKVSSPKINVDSSPPITISNAAQINQKVHMPVIAVAPNSKLMRPKPTLDERITVQATQEMRREQRILKANTKKRRNSRCSSTVTSQTFQKQNSTSVLKPQDLRIMSPPISHEGSPNSSTMLPQQPNISSPPISLNPRIPNFHMGNFSNPLLGINPPSFFNSGQHNFQDPRLLRPHFFPHQNFIPRPMFSNEQMRPNVSTPLQYLGLGTPPPVTVLVPYPVILPIPLPIPIPIPIMNFLRAYESKKFNITTEHKPQEKVNEDSNISDEPLDFTIHQKSTTHQNVEERNDIEEEIATVSNNTENPTSVQLPRKISSEGTDINEDIMHTNNNNEVPNHLEASDTSNPEQTLPRFKISRLGAKMSKVVIPKTKELLESTRPLRKRRRLVDVPAEDECAPVVSKTRKTVHV